ncbi:hypothetical protein [Streptomyces sp. NPDC086010]|uniref:hypothetical protein n=1 Tax=Streptomyces sp. NPDC086010 TaxID=3365745 RepID=UPI0037CEF6CF
MIDHPAGLVLQTFKNPLMPLAQHWKDTPMTDPKKSDQLADDAAETLHGLNHTVCGQRTLQYAVLTAAVVLRHVADATETGQRIDPSLLRNVAHDLAQIADDGAVPARQ